MKKNIYYLVTLLFFSFQNSAQNIDSSSSELYQALDEKIKNVGINSRSINEVYNILSLWPVSLRNDVIFADWVKEKCIQHKDISELWLMYCKSLLKLAEWFKKTNQDQKNLMTTAVFAYYTSFLLALEDAARCADQSASGYTEKWLRNDLYKSLSSYVKENLSHEDKQSIIESCLNVISLRKLEYINFQACHHGMEAYINALKKQSCHSQDEKSNVVVCNTDDYQPELISDEKWVEARKDLRKNYEKILLNMMS